ncbi:hypothetical protein [Thermogemmatispora carboxidivorans]|uniref:hypothetical protein n=1 Tax=Thermogemmatispora carboxidivorans TaxID=1382306 RepID=UPI00069C8AFC|nr:hypothetical protein [Thermogemmatispora carboxidivorans]
MTNTTKCALEEITLEQIREILAARGWGASLWHTDDVQMVRPDLTAEQSMQVLERCMSKHDAEIGMNWLFIETIADDLFPEKEGQ